MWETSQVRIEKSLGSWRKMIGDDGEDIQITKERYSGLDTSSPKHGKVDEKNEPHVGGNIWAGGTGGLSNNAPHTKVTCNKKTDNFII